jgi:HD-GYP domain-containing protein (c-di-GMP phosphodiesterase class II)
VIARTEWERLVHEAIAELAAGATAVGLYGSEHPRAVQAVERLRESLEELLAEGPEFPLVLLGEELFVQNRPLTRSSRQGLTLLRRFRRKGLEHVIFRRGVTAAELQGFVEELAATDEREVQPRSHIQVGRVELSDRELGGPDDDEGGAQRKKLQVLRDRVSIVHEVFTAFGQGRELAVSELETVVRAQLLALVNDPDPLQQFAPWEGEVRWPAVHAHNVSALVVGMARLAGLGAVTAVDLGMAAMLHDVGKVFLPPDAQARELDLDADELELLLDHPRTGLQALLPVGQLAPLVLVVVAEHHLNYDGTGYPRLSRPRRPHPAARLVAVADAFVVLFTARGGRGFLSREGTMAWLAEHEGTMLDPGWTGALCQLLGRSQPFLPPWLTEDVAKRVAGAPGGDAGKPER